MIKRICLSVILILILPTFFIFPVQTKATTLKDLYNNLLKLEEEAALNQDAINKTEAEIAATQKDIEDTYNKIEQAKEDIETTNAEILELENNIEAKDEETKRLLVYLQVSNSGNMYLEYAMGAQTVEDFIYRMAVVEQLSEYNESLITEMNHSITLNNQKKEDLADYQRELGSLQDVLAVKLSDLGKEQASLYEFYRDLEDEIYNARVVIKNYEDSGCELNDDISVCGQLPADTSFWRPMTTGYVTSEWGYRYSPINGSYELHEGIDVSNGEGSNANLYAIANGKVAKIFYDQYGGNQLVIHHYVNGTYYSSSYAHMSSIYVKENDIVTKDTIVGKMGATGSVTGVHLHLAISTGRRYIDYVSYNDYVSRTVNPRTLINFPSGYSSWYNRTSKY